MEVKHEVFNPQWGSLKNICENQQKDGWILERIVPVYQYEAVAVFVRQEVSTGCLDSDCKKCLQDEPKTWMHDAGDRLVEAAFEVMDKTNSTSWVLELANNAIKGWTAAQRNKPADTT